MALNLADYLSSDPALIQQLIAQYGGPGAIGTLPVTPRGPVLTTMPIPGRPTPTPISDPRRPTPVPTAPMPMPGNPPPINGNIYHPSTGTGYTPGGTNMYNTPFVRDYVSPLLPQGEYQLRLNKLGMGDTNSRRGQFALSKYGDTQRLYQAAQLRNPALSFRDFLKKGGAGGLPQQWMGMSAAARGLNPASRSSVIRLG